MWIALVTMALAEAPKVEVAWKGDEGQVHVQAPPGHHIAPEAPSYIALSWGDRTLDLAVYGTDVDRGVSVWDVRGERIEGDLRLSVCEDAGTTCQLVEVAVTGEIPTARKGSASLDVAVPTAPEVKHSPYKQDAQAIADAAFAKAEAEGKRVLLDFGAVWCPPCNLLSAEVLDAEPRPAELDDVVVAKLDVDDPSSFPLKSTYTVGGYPTLVLAEADGTEISRTTGYDGRDAFLGWLSSKVAQDGSDTDPADVDPSSLSPEEAAALAWKLVQAYEDAAPFLVRAAEAPETPAFRKARFMSEPTTDDLAWLLEHHPQSAEDWLYGMKALTESDEGRAAVLAAVPALEVQVSGEPASDLFYLAALASESPQRELLFAASAETLEATFSGNPEADRAYYTWLASLEAGSGEVDAAIARLDRARTTFPGEPTWDLAAARLLLEAERPEEALQAAARAYDLGWGDNRIRAAMARVKALVALERSDEARDLVDEVVAASPVDDALDVRTHRYLERLKALVE